MWYYEQDKAQQGPVDEPTARRLIADGVIHRRTLVWKEGMIDWQPADATDLGQLLHAPMNRRPDSPDRVCNPYSPPQTIASDPVAVTPSPKLTWWHILFGFKGRIARRHYWGGTLLWIGILIGGTFGGGLVAKAVDLPEAIAILIFPLIFLYLWSVLALQVKRWHDRDRSGVMVLINLIPYIGGIWAFVECGCMRGTVGPNSYGDDPT